MSEIAEILAEFEDETRPEGIADEQWYPATDADFAWCQRKRLKADGRVLDLKALRDEEVAKLEAAFDRRIAQFEAEADRMETLIESGVWHVMPDAKGKRCVKAPGITAFVKRSESWEWPSDDALIAWAGDRAELVRVKTAPDKAAIKAYVKLTGDCPDDLVIRPTERIEIREA